MKYSVSELARQIGVSVRTLHYYDEIGLLSPCEVSEAGYRYYDESSLSTLQEILFFKELGFPLKEIAAILSNPVYNKQEALKNHKTLLQLKKKHLDALLALVDKTMKGELDMGITYANDTGGYEAAQKKYAKEARERWGQSEAYKQSEERTGRYGKSDWAIINKESGEIMHGFAVHRNDPPGSPALQELSRQWQDHITRYFYDCSLEILSGLGEMYVTDGRFTENIDKFGEGTAKCMSGALRYYCEHASNDP